MTARSRDSASLPGAAALAAALAAVAVLVGLIAASGILVGQMLVMGLLIGAGMLLMPLPILLGVLLVVTFLVQGTATYFLRFPQAAWLPYLLSLLLSLKLLDLVNQSSGGTGMADRTYQAWSSPPVVLLALYFVTTLCAIVINRPPIFQVVVALKNAAPLWIVAALFYRGAFLNGFLERAWLLLKLVFFLQLPVVLYQRLVIAPARRDVSTSADAVVGTFGGLIDAGGVNSTLVLFCLLVMAYQLALWSRRQSGLASTVIVWAVGLVIVLAGEVKAVFVWIPLVIVYVLRQRVLSSFGAALAAFGFGAALVAALISAYSLMYWDTWKSTSSHTDIELIDRMSYFFDANNIDYRTGEISRGASVALWASDQATDLARRLVGHGPGASRISATGGLGEVAKRFAPLGISATSVSMLLWDSGLIGLLAFAGVIVTISILLHSAARSNRLSTRERCQADALTVLALTFVSLLVYNRSLNDEPSVQLLLAMCLGCALHWRRKMKLSANDVMLSARPIQ